MRTRSAVALLISAVALLGAAAGPVAAQAPTRLVHGPIAFRLTGYRQAPKSTELVDYRYAMVFKLNRDPLARLRPSNPNLSARVTRGNFYFDGLATHVSRLDAKHATCFFAVLLGGEVSPHLARHPLGFRISTFAHPLTRLPNGKNVLGKNYTQRSKLRTADVRLSSRSARRALHHIGC